MLVKLYTCHPSKKFYNAANNHYRFEYYPVSEVGSSQQKLITHIICISSESSDYTRAEDHCPFRQCVGLTYLDMFIAGPFNFACIN